jgi:hypothetical protein
MFYVEATPDSPASRHIAIELVAPDSEREALQKLTFLSAVGAHASQRLTSLPEMLKLADLSRAVFHPHRPHIPTEYRSLLPHIIDPTAYEQNIDARRDMITRALMRGEMGIDAYASEITLLDSPHGQSGANIVTYDGYQGSIDTAARIIPIVEAVDATYLDVLKGDYQGVLAERIERYNTDAAVAVNGMAQYIPVMRQSTGAATLDVYHFTEQFGHYDAATQRFHGLLDQNGSLPAARLA